MAGTISLYADLCEQAREEAFNKMLTHAGQLGANALIGVRYDATEIAPGITEVLCYGTAVSVETGEGVTRAVPDGMKPLSSDSFLGRLLAKLASVGVSPSFLVSVSPKSHCSSCGRALHRFFSAISATRPRRTMPAWLK